MIDTIESNMAAITTPTFTGIYVGEMLSVPTTPWLIIEYLGEVKLFDTLTDTNVGYEFVVRALWDVGADVSPQVRKAIEVQAVQAQHAIRNALIGDSQLGGNATDLKIIESEVGYQERSGMWHRVVSVTFHAWLYEDGTITA